MRERILMTLLTSALTLTLLPAAARADEKADAARMAQEHQHDKPVATQAATSAASRCGAMSPGPRTPRELCRGWW